MTDDLSALDALAEPLPPNGAKGRVRSAHRHTKELALDQRSDWLGCEEPRPHYHCRNCGRIIDPERSRRGRTSLRAGKDAERAIAKLYPDGRRTGHFGGPDDVLVGDLFIVQSKAGGWFSERVWSELVKLPRTGGRIPTLIVSDRPGPGHRTRRYVVRMIQDDLDLHGPTP